ncbi:MAG: hypothetical protein QOD41_266 [Cryptosporangiaceae bacterium]|jgi:hypothetical protein|nr:hypothetical protein [Cryptosporangiaceae bacterium]
MHSLRNGLVAATLTTALIGVTAPAAVAEPSSGYPAPIPPGTAVVRVVTEDGAGPIDHSARWDFPADDMLIHDRLLDGKASIVVDISTADARGNQPWIQLFNGKDKPLREGTYRGGYNPETAPGEPGVLVAENGIGCYGKATSFTIGRIARDSAGSLSRLEAAVVYRCEGKGAPAMRATISYRS